MDNGCSSCELFYRVFRIPQDSIEKPKRTHLRAYSFLKYNTSIAYKDIPPKLCAYNMPFLVVAKEAGGKELATGVAEIGQSFFRLSYFLKIVPAQLDFSQATTFSCVTESTTISYVITEMQNWLAYK